MSARVLVSVGPQGTQVALWSGGRLVEFRVERPGSESLLGNIYRGRVTRVEAGLGAAFVDIGEPRPGFLPLDGLDHVPVEGAERTVQVVREARDRKGPRLSARPRLAGRLLSFEPERSGPVVSDRIESRPERQRLAALLAEVAQGEGRFVLHRAAAGADAPSLAAAAAALRETWRRSGEAGRGGSPSRLYRDDVVLRILRESEAPPEVVLVDARRAAEALRERCAAVMPELADGIVFRPQREWVPDPAEIREQVEAALEPSAPLPSGGIVLFESGRTLTAIDVDTGSHTGDAYGRPGAERTLLRTNLEAASEIARQLRLRNLGGILVVDFIDLAGREHRRRVVEALRAAVAADPAPCRVGPMSALGLVEMTRRRAGASLGEQMTVSCPRCEGSGRIHRGQAGADEREGGRDGED